MSKPRILVVDNDIDISDMLKIYFSGMDYDVYVAVGGSEALEKVRQVLPHLIILEVMLPDIDGYEVCRILRSDPRTTHIRIIFLTQKDARSDRLRGLELGADDYITKPFDVEELRLRVQGEIRRLERERITHPRSGLPELRLINEHLFRIIQKQETDLALLYLQIRHFEPYQEVYGKTATNEVLWFTAKIIRERLGELNLADSIVGHLGEKSFVIILPEKYALAVREKLKTRFAAFDIIATAMHACLLED
jgi:DNA-binding response OmpR family regulator